MPVGIGPSWAVSKGSVRCEAFEALTAGQVDAVKDHLELAGAPFHAGRLRGRVGEVVTALLQPLTPQAEAVAAPVKDLEAVSTFIAQDVGGHVRMRVRGHELLRV